MKRYLTLLVALAVAVSLSLLTFFLTRGWEQTRAMHAFRGIASDRVQAIQAGIAGEEAALKYLQSFYLSSASASSGNFQEFAREFRSFTRTAVLEQAGVDLVVFLHLVNGPDRARVTQTMREHGRTSFQITDRNADGASVAAGERSVYIPVFAAEPLTRNAEWQGLDMWADPTFRPSLQLAASTGSIAATGPQPSSAGSAGASDFWLFVPLILRTSPTDALAGKRASLDGFFGVDFRADRVVENALRELSPSGIDISIYDLPATGDKTLIYTHLSRTRKTNAEKAGPADTSPPYEWATTLMIGGRTWEIVSRPAPAFVRNHTYFLSWAVLGAGLLSTAILVAFLAWNIGRTSRIERIVAERTGQLSEEVLHHRATEQSLKEAHEDLTRRIEIINRRTREIELLSGLGDILQTCQSLSEAYKAIAQYSVLLFPRDNGALFVFDDQHTLLEQVAAWGAPVSGETMFPLDDCWAMRRGKSYLFRRGSGGLMCSHVSDDSRSGFSYLCLPLTAQGETIGMLHLQHVDDVGSTDGGQAAGAREPNGHFDESRERLAAATAEHAAMAFVNLKLRESLRQQSIRDPLTKLYNRRYMEESVDREIHRAARSTASLAVIILDIDHFKSFNDTYGHEAGDLVLRSVGDLLQRSLRGEDIPCRFGGEEFVLILPGASLESARVKAESLRRDTAGMKVEYAGSALPQITISLGVAVLNTQSPDGAALFHAADDALYRAKKGGRNRVEIASG